MKAKQARFEKGSDPDIFDFSTVKLGGHGSSEFFVRFYQDKAFEADYSFKPEVEAKV